MIEPKKPSYTLQFAPAAVRDLERLVPNVRSKIFSDVEKLTQNPRPHGVEEMQTKEKLCRIYVGPGKNYRAIYRIQDEALVVLVVKAGDRKEVYRRVK
jgi:mRNA interferase RelE/StbE